MGLPAGVRVELELVPGSGVATDVTGWVRTQPGVKVQVGRRGDFTTTPPGELSLTLDNADGRFTPLRQTLKDGVTAHPYWPNLRPRRRIRYSWTDEASVRHNRFVGYVHGWSPTLQGGLLGLVSVTASDRMALLDQVQLSSPLRQVIAADGPSHWWPLDDVSGSTQAADIAGTASQAVPMTLAGGSAGPVTFGDSDGPGVNDGGSVDFAPATATAGQVLLASLPQQQLGAIAAFVKVAAPPAAESGFLSVTSAGHMWLTVDTSGRVVWHRDNNGVLEAPVVGPVIADGRWHEVAVIYRTSAGGDQLVVDGVSTPLPAGEALLFAAAIGVGATPAVWGGARFTGKVAHVTTYLGDAVLSGGVFLPGHGPNWGQHTAAATGYAGETVDARIARLLGYAGLTAADWQLDASTVTLGAYASAGRSVAQAVQDATGSEGGGAVTWFDPAAGSWGKVRFLARASWMPSAPSLTVDAYGDLVGADYAPQFDDSLIVNTVTAARQGASGQLSTQVAVDAASVAEFGVVTDQVSTWTQSDGDALAVAQFELAARSQPVFRMPQLPVDAFTGLTAAVRSQVAATRLNARTRVTGLPAAGAPVTQVDGVVLGWTETCSDSEQSIVFDVAPADSPAVFVLEDPVYGHLVEDAGSLTLAAPAAVGAVTVSVATAVGHPTLSTAAADYPLLLAVEGELMTVTGAPSGSGSPQTLPVTRGVNGTTPVAHAAGVTVSVWTGALAL